MLAAVHHRAAWLPHTRQSGNYKPQATEKGTA